jgi:hypothetical protein
MDSFLFMAYQLSWIVSNYESKIDWLIDWLIDWRLTPTLAIFQLYRGVWILRIQRVIVTYIDIYVLTETGVPYNLYHHENTFCLVSNHDKWDLHEFRFIQGIWRIFSLVNLKPLPRDRMAQ